MDVHERIQYIEQRLMDLEKRLPYNEEAEYHKYLIASQSKHALAAIEQYKEPVKEIKSSTVRKIMMWPRIRK